MITRKYILPLFIIISLVTPTIYTYAQGEFILPSTQIIIEGAEKIPSVPTNDVLNAAKETRLSFSIFGINIHLPFGMDTIAIAVVKHILESIVDSTTNWINSGFNGNPAYVSNPKQYFTDIADGAAGEFIIGSDLNFLCSPFQTQVRLALLKAYVKPNPFQCTLTEVVDNIDAFYGDFSQGGWDGWFAMTQNNSNNPYGAYLDAKVALDSRLANAVGLKREQLDWGRGFLSFEKCPEGKELDPTDGTGDCMVEKSIVTPGSVIESQLENVLGTGVRQLELADEFDELVGALLGQLLEKSVLGAKGLFSAPKVSSGSSGGGALPGSGGTLDIDGDGISDGIDTNGDGVLDVCYFGGTTNLAGQSSCTGSFGLVPTTPSPTTPPPTIPPSAPPSGGGGSVNIQPPLGDAINLNQVIFLHTNVSSWPITSDVTNISVTSNDVCVNHTKAGQWPTSPFGTIQVEGNVWIFAQFGGQWYGATWDWLRVGQTCKGITASEFGRDQVRISPMDASWIPSAGDQIGFMMSTRARDNVSAGQERTNVVLITWPY